MCADPSVSPDSPWPLSESHARAIEAEVIPRLLVSHRVGPISPDQVLRATALMGEAEVEEFVRLVRAGHDRDPDDYVEELIARGASAESIYLDLLAPTARRLGEYWTEDVCDFVEVTVAVGRVQRVLRGLSRLLLADTDGRPVVGRALLACVSGEQHTLGLFMVAEFFVRAGWSVSVGPPLLQEDLAALVRTQWFDVVGFSVACDTRLGQVTRDIRRVRRASRNEAVRVLVGGRIFDERPELAKRVGADAAPADARVAPVMAASMLQA